VTKPFDIEEVLARVATHVALRRTARELAERNRLLEEEIERHRRARQTIDHLRREIESELKFNSIIGRSPAILAAVARLDQVAGTDTTVLIEGETAPERSCSPAPFTTGASGGTRR
jgi:transcriptional regulator with GAF, ATPase, and Fis domain